MKPLYKLTKTNKSLPSLIPLEPPLLLCSQRYASVSSRPLKPHPAVRPKPLNRLRRNQNLSFQIDGVFLHSPLRVKTNKEKTLAIRRPRRRRSASLKNNKITSPQLDRSLLNKTFFNLAEHILPGYTCVIWRGKEGEGP